MADLAPWVVVALAAAVALAFHLRARAAAVAHASAEIDAEKLRGELAATREQLTKSATKQRRLGEEAQQLRRKLEKARKRAGQAAGAPAATASRVSELEVELEQARQARDAAREEVQAIGAELTRLRAEAKREPTAPTKPEVPQVAETPLLDNAAIAALQARATAAESDVESGHKELAEHRRVVERLRGKLQTQEALYVSIRSELGAKKDRLRTQQEEIERLQALKVALVDAPSSGAPPASDAALPSPEAVRAGEDASPAEPTPD